MTTKQTDALGDVAAYTYDGSSNLISCTGPDSCTTKYSCNALDLMASIDYNRGKEVFYRHNKTSNLMSVTNWLGTCIFELDLLHHLTDATAHASKYVNIKKR